MIPTEMLIEGTQTMIDLFQSRNRETYDSNYTLSCYIGYTRYVSIS